MKESLWLITIVEESSNDFPGAIPQSFWLREFEFNIKSILKPTRKNVALPPRPLKALLWDTIRWNSCPGKLFQIATCMVRFLNWLFCFFYISDDDNDNDDDVTAIEASIVTSSTRLQDRKCSPGNGRCDLALGEERKLRQKTNLHREMIHCEHCI